MKYVVLIPARDEEHGIAETLDSLVSQTLRPQHALVINDHSQDGTTKVIDSYTRKYGFVSYIDYPHNDAYVLGGKIVKMVKFAIHEVLDNFPDVEYIVKMDADIKFDKGFFKTMSGYLSGKNVGIASGTPYYEKEGEKVFINSPLWHTNGDFKVYNSKFLKYYDKLPEDLGWDCADNVIARENGFDTIVYRDLIYRQNRPIGRDSVLKGRKRQGRGAFKLRYPASYLMLKFAHDAVNKPYLVGAFYYLSGYFEYLLSDQKPVLTNNQKSILRKLMWSGLSSRSKNMEFSFLQKLKKS